MIPDCPACEKSLSVCECTQNERDLSQEISALRFQLATAKREGAREALAKAMRFAEDRATVGGVGEGATGYRKAAVYIWEHVKMLHKGYEEPRKEGE